MGRLGERGGPDCVSPDLSSVSQVAAARGMSLVRMPTAFGTMPGSTLLRNHECSAAVSESRRACLPLVLAPRPSAVPATLVASRAQLAVPDAGAARAVVASPATSSPCRPARRWPARRRCALGRYPAAARSRGRSRPAAQCRAGEKQAVHRGGENDTRRSDHAAGRTTVRMTPERRPFGASSRSLEMSSKL